MAGSQLPDDVALALDAAVNLSQSDPDNLSFPWFDRTTNEVVVTAATAAGLTKAATFDPVAAARPMPKPTGKHATVAPFKQHRAAAVTHSRRYLQKIMDETIGVGTLTTVIANFPDPQTGRVLLEVAQAPAAFLSSLAAKYDPSAIEVVIVANPPIVKPQTRNYDASPFWGGANINVPAGGCTDAWPWIDSSNYYMITAGHCGPDGGSVSTPAQSMGWINSWESNWLSGTGSVRFPGASDYSGDLSLIRVNGGLQSGTGMYVGGPGAANYLTVREMWSRSPQAGDQYCTGGAYSGELCGWVTQVARGNFTHSDGTVARNVSWGTKGGTCTTAGDSGGPIYTVRSDGTIAAKGIHSGGGGGCIEIYSDIWDAYWAYPGWLNTA